MKVLSLSKETKSSSSFLLLNTGKCPPSFSQIDDAVFHEYEYIGYISRKIDPFVSTSTALLTNIK